ncbi:SDR family oxidoreductase [Pseudoroseomonas cervicalis]|uniref:SDR family oxidoreductase n=1 Tax=Teichococcus cervicalis TaxID=204525 RepID=UPI0027877FB7|nr:SDR family oxidoreductase [Pseudoroseomonas cervicalis]MDQ1081491.1 nucleoside-diphosphate-sugar epimerase [Pseudoroseomonas cervicalis]
MRIFLTGATGFIGARILPELQAAGHRVLGLTRSEAGAARLRAAGAEPHFGDIDDPDSLRDGVARSDAVIHTAFDHDFTNYVENCQRDDRAIRAMGAALLGSDRPLVITSATPMGMKDGAPAVEDHFDTGHRTPRVASELAAQAVLEQGVNVSVVRLSQIHDRRRQGLVTEMIALARRSGVSAQLGAGRNGWSAAHVSDTARLYRLALEAARPGARYHATAEETVPFHAIAATIGQRLGLPVVSLEGEAAAAHFGWLSLFAGRDMAASSALTRAALGWQPTGPDLLSDLAALELEEA